MQLFGVGAGLLEFIPLVGPLAVGVGAAVVASFHSINQGMWVVAFPGTQRLAQDRARETQAESPEQNAEVASEIDLDSQLQLPWGERRRTFSDSSSRSRLH